MEKYSAAVGIRASVHCQRLTFIYFLKGVDFLAGFLLQLHQKNAIKYTDSMNLVKWETH